ncbi:hypothetical protein ACLMJK_004876 [Lecanora helva]
MEHNIIATLAAVNESAGTLFRQPHNTAFYLAPTPLPLPNLLEDASRETSLSTDGDTSCNSRIQLTFERRPREITRGFTFGSNPKICDIFLPKSSISNIHFSISFDEDGRLCLIDSSSHGTWVSYNGQRSRKPRHFFTWLLPKKDRIEVDIGEKDPVRFVVQVPAYENCEEAHFANLNTYLDDRQRAKPPSTQQLSNQTTPRSIRVRSPRRRPWYYQGRELGRGSFGTVHEARNVTTGIWYALKRFNERGRVAEIDVVRKLSHVNSFPLCSRGKAKGLQEHIVQYIDTFVEDGVYLVMELLPLGSLLDENRRSKINLNETVEVLSQILKALQYIHDYGYAHRDITPTNVLIKSRRPMYIKLADFGTSQDTSVLRTLCGTSTYRAPEIWSIATSNLRNTRAKGKVYTAAVDIWSTGVVIFRLAYSKFDYNNSDPKTTIKAVKEIKPDPLIDILRDFMIVEDHNARLAAEACLKKASAILKKASLRPNAVG